MEDQLYTFENLKTFLNLNGFSVKEPYMPVDPTDVEWYEGGKHIEYEKDGIYLVKRNGGRQKVFLYRKDFYRTKPTFHVFCCPKVQKDFIGRVFRCGNTGTVPVVRDKKKQENMSDLPICGYCAEMAELQNNYNSTSYINLLRRGQSIVDVHTNENLSVYSEQWRETRHSYIKSVNAKCERCGVKIEDPLEQEKFLMVVHRNHIYNDDTPKNLECLCLDCLSKTDHRSVWVNGGNRLTLEEYRQKYHKRG